MDVTANNFQFAKDEQEYIDKQLVSHNGSEEAHPDIREAVLSAKARQAVLEDHTRDSFVHITQVEREKWNNVVGYSEMAKDAAERAYEQAAAAEEGAASASREAELAKRAAEESVSQAAAASESAARSAGQAAAAEEGAASASREAELAKRAAEESVSQAAAASESAAAAVIRGEKLEVEIKASEAERAEAEAVRQEAEENRVAVFKASYNKVANTASGTAGGGSAVSLSKVSPVTHPVDVKVTSLNLLNLDAMLNECLVKNEDGSYTMTWLKDNDRFSKTVDCFIPAGGIHQFMTTISHNLIANSIGVRMWDKDGNELSGGFYKDGSVRPNGVLRDAVKIQLYLGLENGVGASITFKDACIKSWSNTSQVYTPYVASCTLESVDQNGEVVDTVEAFDRVPTTILSTSPNMEIKTGVEGVKIECMYNKDTNLVFGNALTGSVIGEDSVLLSDVSPVTHPVGVKVSSLNLLNLDAMLNECLVKNSDGSYTMTRLENQRFSKRVKCFIPRSLTHRYMTTVSHNLTTSSGIAIREFGKDGKELSGGGFRVDGSILLDPVLEDAVEIELYIQAGEPVGASVTFRDACIKIESDTSQVYTPYVESCNLQIINESGETVETVTATDRIPTAINSVSPTMQIVSDTEEGSVKIECTYNKDTNKVIENVNDGLAELDAELDKVAGELSTTVGDFETALDSIIAIQNALIGGDGV